MKVLIAVDDQLFGEALATFVSEHNWPANTEFAVLNCVSPIDLNHSPDIAYLPFLESTQEESLLAAKALVRHVALKVRDSLKSTQIEEVILEGNPKEEILSFANSWKADMIVIGSHSRHGLSLFVLGSVSAAVVSHASCTTVVVRLPYTSKFKEPNKQAITSGIA